MKRRDFAGFLFAAPLAAAAWWRESTQVRGGMANPAPDDDWIDEWRRSLGPCERCGGMADGNEVDTIDVNLPGDEWRQHMPTGVMRVWCETCAPAGIPEIRLTEARRIRIRQLQNREHGTSADELQAIIREQYPKYPRGPRWWDAVG